MSVALDRSLPKSAVVPTALGVGLRRPHFAALLEGEPRVDFLEVLSDNFLRPAPHHRRVLAQLAESYPMVLHGVALNLLGPEVPDARYLDALAALAERVDAPFFTDHLCWTAAHGLVHHDLLPVPFVEELADLAAERIRRVAAHVGRPFGIENVSSYVTFARSRMSEWAFLSAVAERADCGILLDVNNVYVSARNHGFDPSAYLAAIDRRRVLLVHLAGHTREPGVLVDTHDAVVADPVLALYAEWIRGGSVPTLVEWDQRIPPLEVLLAELDRIRAARTEGAP